jgi:glycosyltransferase involved in cell wall biosynthesis
MKILLISGHKKNWGAGASGLYLNLHKELHKINPSISLMHEEDYVTNKKTMGLFVKLAKAFLVEKHVNSNINEADIVEVAGNIGWRLFRSLHSLNLHQRPLLVVRLHGLEFKDEQVRITEEIARLMRIPIKYKLLNRHWTNWQEFQTLKLADIVICSTSREADAIVVAGLKHESQVRVCPLGIDSDYVCFRKHRSHANKLLWWGSWIERKGANYLPRAFELSVRELPNLSLTIGGSSSCQPQDILKSFAPELRSHITILPFVSKEKHIATLLDHDMFIFPSLSEGFGLALLEAMATGIPCITTLTGMYDWLEHGKNCYVIPMCAPTAMSSAIKRLSQNVELRKSIGERARETAKTLSWQSCAKRTLDIYSESLAELQDNFKK